MSWPIFITFCLLMGLVLLLIEIFIVPGFGPVGIGAIIFLAFGGYLSWIKLSFGWALAVTFVSIFSVVFSFIFLKKSGLSNRFVLGSHVGKSPSSQRQKQAEGKVETGSGVSTGEIGMAMCDLRPTGIAEFGNQRVNVLTDGIYIKKGTAIKITRIEGNRIFVDEADACAGKKGVRCQN
ncbi:MAG: NfeD family protein [bacterium]